MASVSFDVVANMDEALTTVKEGVNKISDYVSNLGKNKVDWTEMLTGDLDPATIIGAITTLFATAVLATGSFQADLQNSSANASNAFSDNMGQMGEAAVSASEATGASLNNTTSSLAAASTQWADPSMQNAIATFADTLSTMGGQFGNASENAISLSQVLKAFGINSVPAANQAMYDLYTASKNSTLGFSAFTSTLTQSGPSLSNAHIGIQQAADTLASLSTQSGQTAQTAQSSFQQIADAINPANIQLNAVVKTIPGISDALSSGNLVAAFTSLESYFATGSVAAQQIGIAAGVSSDNIVAMSNSGKGALKDLSTGFTTLKTAQDGFNGDFKPSLDSIGQLQVTWNKFEAEFEQSFGPMGEAVINWSTALLSNATTTMSDWKDTVVGTVQTLASGGLNVAFDALNNELAQGQAQSLQTQTQQEDLLRTVLGQSSLQGNNGAIAGGNASKLIATAETSTSDPQLLSQLIDALKTGNTSNLSSISNNLNIGTINTQNQSPQQIEAALYAALYKKFQTG